MSLYHPKISKICIALLLACSTCLFPYASAYADVRASDDILGISAIERDLPVAKCPSVSCEFCTLIDADGKVIFERNAQTPTKIASITKIMTAYVALQYCDSDEIITVSENAGTMEGSSAELEPGDTLTFLTALYCLMIPSGNDAAVAIAEHVGAKLLADDSTDFGTTEKPTDAVNAFVAMMNKYATLIGCSDTLYVNPHGLDDSGYEGQHHSTAADQGLIAKEAMTNSVFRDIVKSGTTTVQITRNGQPYYLELVTTDYLLTNYDYCIGIKTGTTDLAGSCYVGAMLYEGYECYAVILDAENDAMRFQDAQDLFNWIINHRVDFPLVNSSITTEMKIDGEDMYVPVLAEVAHTGWVNKTFKVTAADPNGTVAAFDIEGNVSLDIHYDNTSGNIRMGDKVGTIDYVQRNVIIYTCDLIACEDCAGPNIFEMIGVWWDRLIRSHNNESTCAVTKEVYTPKYLVNYASAA